MEDFILTNLKYDSLKKDLVSEISEKIIDKMKGILPIPKKEKVYLSRKKASEKLGISAPTLDSYVEKQLIMKYGKGKNTRFLLDDIENFYENLNKIYYKQKPL